MRIKMIENIKNNWGKKWYRQNFFVLLIGFVLIASLSIGYSILSQNFNIKGEVSLIASSKDLKIISINSNPVLSCGYDVYNSRYTNDSVTINLNLPSLECSMEYNITIENKSGKAMELVNMFKESYNNQNIDYVTNGLNVGKVIANNEILNFTIKFKYKTEIQSLPENKDLGAIIKFVWREHISNGPNELVFSKELLEQGSTYIVNNATIEITTDNLNGAAGLSITGRPVTGWDTMLRGNMIRWYLEIDLTNYTKLSFYAKNGALHGAMAAYIDDNRKIFYNWGDYGWHGTTNWLHFEIDLTEYTGVHMLTLIGGHVDWSGSPTSNTQYCDIKLIRD